MDLPFGRWAGHFVGDPNYAAVMNIVEVVRDAAADLWSIAGHHVPEASLALGLFTLVLTQVQTFRFRRKG